MEIIEVAKTLILLKEEYVAQQNRVIDEFYRKYPRNTFKYFFGKRYYTRKLEEKIDADIILNQINSEFEKERQDFFYLLGKLYASLNIAKTDRERQQVFSNIPEIVRLYLEKVPICCKD